MKLKKTYKYALWSALYLTVFSTFLSTLIYFLLFKYLGLLSYIVFSLVIFIFSFFVIQFRAEHFIYQRIKKLYEDISFLDVNDLKRKKITTDVEALTKTVQEFIEGKSEEIADLTQRDSFRRDFLGNVAHELKTPLFTVQGYILTLIEGAADDKEIRTKYLERASKGVERLTSIVKDLDMIAKLETEEMVSIHC